MSTSSESFSSAIRGPITVTPPLSPSYSSEYSPPATTIASGSNHAEPSTKRKRGRPRKTETSKGKAPMVPAAPKRGRGRPRKEKPPIPQTEPAPHMVTFGQFHEAYWEHRHQTMLQNERIRQLELELGVAKDMIKRREKINWLHQEILEEMHRWSEADSRRLEKIEASVKDIVRHLQETSGYEPSAPSS